MRYPVKIDLDCVEKWVSTVEAKSDKQKAFVETTREYCCKLRERNDIDIVLDVENDVVLYRYNDGQEQVATSEEIQLFYAQCMAKGIICFESI